MKKILFAFAIFAIAILALPRQTWAQTEQIQWYLNISDVNCPQPYHGTYCCEVWIEYDNNGTKLCDHAECYLTLGNNPINYSCTFLQATEKKYYIHAKVWRQDSSQCGGGDQYIGPFLPGHLTGYQEALNYVL